MEEIIEAYYRTAADLRRNAEHMLRISEYLAEKADRMSEERMREKQPTESEEGK